MSLQEQLDGLRRIRVAVVGGAGDFAGHRRDVEWALDGLDGRYIIQSLLHLGHPDEIHTDRWVAEWARRHGRYCRGWTVRDVWRELFGGDAVEYRAGVICRYERPDLVVVFDIASRRNVEAFRTMTRRYEIPVWRVARPQRTQGAA